MNLQFLFSLLAFSYQLNNTLGNQGDHCIVAASQDQSRVHDNLVLDGSGDACQKQFEPFLLELVGSLDSLGLTNLNVIRGVI